MLSSGSCWPCIFLYSVYMMTLWVRCFTKPHQEPGKTAENLHEPLKAGPLSKEPYSDGVISNDVVFRLTRLGFAIMWTGHTGVKITTFLSRLFNFWRPWLWGTSPNKYKSIWESTYFVVSVSKHCQRWNGPMPLLHWLWSLLLERLEFRLVEKRDIHIPWDYLVDKSPTLVSKTNVHSL